ncbi:RidA family protein [Nonomuraea muscovyensis]|uniref:RidA family protein n=1 Tax=Nonomuraea muscovyensis TaxID=1124761 RepID=UPI003405AFEB
MTNRSPIQHRLPISLVNSPALQQPLGHYSHLSVHSGLAFISGQLPVDAGGRVLAGEPFTEQARQVLRNLDACLAAVGADRSRLLQVTCYVTDISNWPAFDALYREWIGDHRPARAVAGASELHYGSAIEIHAVCAAH